ncbi:MAG: DUF2835 family protein [Endozoicomonadaceae bacterium]|nr:DUF2835 family protein [Endozoicomonadaceae bacterium]MCY4330903.1 DUF2835 family protein [Endozoicomonadaceae bacterium]
MAKKATFSVYLNSEQVLGYYRGQKQSIRTQTSDGQSISIPFNVLLDFVTHDGISGTFEIHFREDGKLQKIMKIS